MNAALERIEPILSYAQAVVPAGNWAHAHRSLRACLDFAELHRAPQHAEYNSAHTLESIVRSAGRPIQGLGGPGASLTGDSIQAAAIACAALRNAVLESDDADLRVACAEVDGVPVWQFSIDGPGRFAADLLFDFDLTLDSDTAELIWTSASRGGRIDRRAGEIDLRLKGVRAVLDLQTGCDDFIVPLREAEHLARVLASGETITNESEKLRDALQNILQRFDEQDDTPKPCDLAALTRESFRAPTPEDPIRLDVAFAREIPPQSLRRNRMLRLLTALQRLSRGALVHGGAVHFEIDYTLSQRVVTMLANGEGKTEIAPAQVYVPAINRAVNAQGGSCETDFSDSGFTILITFPDHIALALDIWLPGWDTFAPRSSQMLRLLKSGGPVPPEDLILNGVLEDELERHLLPRLGIAPAATLIHDLNPRKPALNASSQQRIEKVFSQVKRAKPKKEICAPVYAAEIIYMFAIDQRHASAIGLRDAKAPQTTELAKTLSATPLDHLKALRLLPQVFTPES